MQSPNQGLLIATGERHCAEAVSNAQASRPFVGDRPIVLITDRIDQPFAAGIFDLVLPHPDPRHGYRDKIAALLQLPFAQTLFWTATLG